MFLNWYVAEMGHIVDKKAQEASSAETQKLQICRNLFRCLN